MHTVGRHGDARRFRTTQVVVYTEDVSKAAVVDFE